MSKKVITITSLMMMLFVSTLVYSHTATSTPLNVNTHAQTPVSHDASHHSSHHASKKLSDVNPRVWQLAVKAYNKALTKGYIKQKIVTVIDYSLPSSQKRLWVIDMHQQKVLLHILVSHGKNTGGLFAKNFSNKHGSLATSIGTFVTENTYSGSHGYSLRLRGLEPGFNENAKSRAIVIHGAKYATQDFVSQHGRLGHSWGCPAVSPHLAKPLIDHIKGGSLVFAYYPDAKWLQHSKFLA
jgi:hypothetical protein